MRYTAFLALGMIVAAVPAFAQDRTPPAGSLRALQPAIDLRPSQYNDPAYSLRAPFEGRSASDRRDLDGGAQTR